METDDKPLVNRVAASSLMTLNLEDYFPKSELVEFDLKDFLFRGLILKEKDFREALKEFNWSSLSGKMLAVHCSADAIIPTWAYMLVASYAAQYVESCFLGTPDEMLKSYYRVLIEDMDLSYLRDRKVIVKGCSKKPVPASAYVDLTRKLRPLVQSIMYGEPCSTVPIYKKPRQ